MGIKQFKALKEKGLTPLKGKNYDILLAPQKFILLTSPNASSPAYKERFLHLIYPPL
ncbi:unnamed protein product, partial [Dovyalis caffra]